MHISHNGLHLYLARLVAITHLLVNKPLNHRSITMSSNVQKLS
jgi:hypothetical protein